jgi:hypothetical protein
MTVVTLNLELFKALFGIHKNIFDQFKHLIVHMPHYPDALKSRNIYSLIMIKPIVISELHGDIGDTCCSHL